MEKKTRKKKSQKQELEVKLGNEYIEQEIKNFQTGYVKDWTVGFTVQSIFFIKFNKNGVDYEFYGTKQYETDPNYKLVCTKIGSETTEAPKVMVIGHLFSADKKASRDYYKRYKTPTGGKLEFNPVTQIAGTGSKHNDITRNY